MYYRLYRRHGYIYYTAIGLLVAAVFVLQALPVFPRVFSVLPLPLLPLVICIAVFNSEVTGFTVGLICGVLIDILSPTADGFNTIVFMLLGVIVGLLTDLLFNNRLMTIALLSFAATAIYYLIYWLVRIVPLGLENGALYLVKYSVPALVYTWLFTFPFYFIARQMDRRSASEAAERKSGVLK